MKKLIRYWNQNRLKIIIIGIIIVFIIILIQVINGILARTKPEFNTENTEIKDTSKPSESVITGGEVKEEVTENNTNIINSFVDFCNKKDYQSAYNLLSQECKSTVFSTLDSFINNYCNKIKFNNITYDLELWYYTGSTYTYRITYFENNILATGNINSDNNIEDYITIVQEDDGNKLNISSFVDKVNVNKMQNNEGVEITINTRLRYRDYESYNITVKNTTDKTILLSEGNNGNDICLVDGNDVEYDSIINEVPLVNLEIAPGAQKTMDIRFYKMYNLYRTVEKISFKNIIKDREMYIQNVNNVERLKVSIDI